MKDLEKKARSLKTDIVKKFGSVGKFSKLIGIPEMEIIQDLTVNVTKKSFSKINALYLSTTRVRLINDELRAELNRKVLEHPDSKNAKLRASYREFFSKNPTWTNTYFSEVMNGTRLKITDKLELLCVKLDIELKNFI